jgi:putative transcriptional regulator
MEKAFTYQGFMTGQLLVAMPQMGDPRFNHSVIYVCVHNEEGAMGLIVNRLVRTLTFPDMLLQLGIEPRQQLPLIQVHSGGPVETGRGFVLHSTDYHDDGTMQINDHIGLTATIDILRNLAQGEGPQHHLLALGYAGWNAGQLDLELQNNTWLTVPPDEKLLFSNNLEQKWHKSFAKIGVDPKLLSGQIGHA